MKIRQSQKLNHYSTKPLKKTWKDKLKVLLAPMETASFFAYPEFSTDNKISKQKRYSGQRDGIFKESETLMLLKKIVKRNFRVWTIRDLFLHFQLFFIFFQKISNLF